MNQAPLIENSLKALGDILSRDLGLPAGSFAVQAEQAAPLLPEDVAQPLRELAAALAQLRSRTMPGPREDADFCFAAGALHEKLPALRQTRMELASTIVGPDSISPTPLQRAQSDQLSRSIEARDRLFRKVADVTLKFLLMGLGLLMLGLLLGII